MGAALLIDLSPLVAQFNQEMLQVRQTRVPAQGAAWGAGQGGPPSAFHVSCRVGCMAGRAELPAPSEAVVVA